MSNAERAEARYQRRKAKRDQKKQERLDKIGTAEEVFAFHKMYKYGKECCKNVMWKQSTQLFRIDLLSRTAQNRENALNGYKPKKLNSFKLSERGKTRQIEAPHIDDRQIQKTLTKEVLLPLYSSHFIHDNGASLSGKGLHFAQDQLDKAMRRHMKEYGVNGWIIIADMKGFFPNADREVIKRNHEEIKDPVLRHVLDTITDSGSGDIGVPLGVEPSQIEMINLPSPMDNYMSCQVGLRGFGHYMDDYHILVAPDHDPRLVLKLLIREANKLGIIVNVAKTQITPFGKPFKFCKMKRYVDDNGKIVRRACRDSVKRFRRKIKHYAETEMPYEDIYTSVNSAMSYFADTDDHGTELKLRREFYKLFGFSCEEIENFRGRENDGIYMPHAV